MFFTSVFLKGWIVSKIRCPPKKGRLSRGWGGGHISYLTSFSTLIILIKTLYLAFAYIWHKNR